MSSTWKWMAPGFSRERLNTMLTQGFAGFGLLMLVLLLSGGLPSGMLIESAAASAAPRVSGSAAAPVILMDGRQQKVAAYLARRYRVSTDVVRAFVAEAYRVGREKGVDPLLILAVVAVESSFNPIAESSFGAKGLMQVVPRFHLDKLSSHGGVDSVLEAPTNIAVGTQILKDYIRSTGSVEAALQMYAGAMADETSSYAMKVIAERDRLHQILGNTVVTSV